MVEFDLDDVDGRIVEDYLAGKTEMQDWIVNTIWDIQEKLGLLAIPTDKKKIPLVKWGKKNNFTGFKSKEEIMILVEKYTKNPNGRGEWHIPAAVALLTTNQFVVCDNDDAADYPAILKSYEDNNIDTDRIYTETTKQGHHSYVWLSRELKEEETKLIDDIKGFSEYKHAGNMIMIAGSYHKTGKKLYKELNLTLMQAKDYTVDADSFLASVSGLRKEHKMKNTSWDIIKPDAPRKFKYSTQDIRDEYNRQNSIESTLSRYGYAQGTEKWIHPNGDSNPETGSVDILGSDLSYHWGSNDPLKGKGTGKDSSCFNSFGIYCEMDHHGDFNEAIKAASVDLGMNVYEDGRPCLPSAKKVDGEEYHETTEADTANWFCSIHGNDMLYSEQEASWYLWNGKYWEKDNLNTFLSSKLLPFIDGTMKKYASKLSNEQPEDARKNSPREGFQKYISKISNYRPLSNIEKLAQGILGFDGTRFDTTRHQVCFSNGTIDLKTGKLMDHKRADHHTRFINQNYVANANCPVWKASLNKITSDSEGNPRPMMPSYLQKCFGYSLTGEIIEQCLFILFGEGQNGKSFITEYIRKNMGGFGKIAQQEVLLDSNNGKQNSFAESNLQGVRMDYVSETKKGEKFDTAKFKRLTNKTIVADRKYEKQMEFHSTHKLWIDCNHKPIIKETDKGTWRRLRLIPFDHVISDAEVDSRIDEKWDEEIEGILAWLVEGAVRWYAEGLGEPPTCCKEALEQYKGESDYMLIFMDECLELSSDSEAFISLSDLYKIYTSWANENGHNHKLTKQGVKKAMLERGLTEKRTAKAKGLGGAFITDDGSEHLHGDAPSYGKGWK